MSTARSTLTTSANRTPRRTLAAAAAVSVAAGVLAPALATSAASAAPSASATTAHRSEVVPFTKAEATLTASGKERVEWKAPGVAHVAVYAAKTATGHGRLVTTRSGSGHALIKAPKGVRPYVRLVPDHGAPLVVAPRLVSLHSVPNFRDAGGYRTKSGQWVRTGMVYRTAQLGLSPADAAKVDKLGIVADYDLRMTSEIQKAADVVPAGAVHKQLNVMGDDFVQTPKISSVADAQELMKNGERYFVSAPSAKAAYHGLLTGIAHAKGPTLYHCTAGKDRTGWASAVLLTLLGVPKKTVVNDYLLSNTYFAPSPQAQALVASIPPSMAEFYKPILLGVERSYLQAGFDEVKKDYGTMDAYARKGLGLKKKTIAKLKAKLLVGAPRG